MRRAARLFLAVTFYLSAGAVALALFVLAVWLFTSDNTAAPLQNPGQRVGTP